MESKYGWKKVKKSEHRGRGTVCNLSVEEDESYMADGAIAHNCQSFSISGRQGGFTDARGTLFFEILRLAAAKVTPVLLLEGHRTRTTIARPAAASRDNRFQASARF